MKIFIIGPEGAGKTVFATVLNNYVNNNPASNLVFRESDIQTKKYLVGLYESLKNGEWPGSTISGRMVELNWEWQSGKHISQARLIDASGQDMRSELAGTSEDMHILEYLNDTDLVIMLVDLYDHQQDNSNKRIENAWIVQSVLQNIKKEQDLILAVSKADLLISKLPSQLWGDSAAVLKLLREMMPEFNYAGFSSFFTRKNIQVLAFSSVETESREDDKGRLIRLPRHPLKARGFTQIVMAIRHAWKNYLIREVIKKLSAWFHRHYLKIAALLALGILVMFLSSVSCPIKQDDPEPPPPVPCEHCGGDGQVEETRTCPDCRGSGNDGLFGLGDCSRCAGSGEVHVFQKCPVCNGTGFIQTDNK